jgi:hypothetical protein
MEYISSLPEIELVTSCVRSFNEKPNGNKLFPFVSIHTKINDVYHCPFCDKEITYFNCSCNEFVNKLKKLQETLQDRNHESRLHHEKYASTFVHSKSIIDEISLKPLSKKEISNLDPDFWDYAETFSDSMTKTAYMVSNANYDTDKLIFHIKNLQTKTVYQCTLDGIKHFHFKIYLGYYREKTVSNGSKRGPRGGRLIGNYHIEKYWEDIAEFEDWDAFCKMLQSV